MTTTSKYYIAAGVLIAAVVASTVASYPHLPNMVPMHWDAHGNVNGWGPKWTLFAINPGIMAMTLLIFYVLPWLSPKQFAVELFRSTSLYIMVTMLALLAYIHLLILAASLSWMVDVGRAVEGGICLLLALMGNVLGKVRRNFFIGVRTPWTIANEQVWNATHRFAAKTFFGGGIVGLLAILLHAPFWLPIAAIFTAALAPVIYSLVFYKQLERRGAL
jgi:uncharacterized membrane protein